MRLVSFVLTSALAICACAPSAERAAAPACATAETLASYPNGQFLENLIVEPNGRVLFTSYFARAVESYLPGQEAATFAPINAYPVAIAAYPGGYIVTAHGAPFSEGPAFTQTKVVLLLDSAGREIARIPAPDARFLNGIGALPDGTFLIADSIAARIWRFDPTARTLSVWLEAPELAPDATGADQRPGANGVEVVGDAVLISNSFRGAVYRVALGADNGPDGALTLVGEPGAVDDFAVAPDGSIYLATHRNTLLRLGSDGAVTTVLPEGADGSTAVALTPDGDALYALTTGALFEGGREQAKLLRVPLPGGDDLCRAE